MEFDNKIQYLKYDKEGYRVKVSDYIVKETDYDLPPMTPFVGIHNETNVLFILKNPFSFFINSFLQNSIKYKCNHNRTNSQSQPLN